MPSLPWRRVPALVVALVGPLACEAPVEVCDTENVDCAPGAGCDADEGSSRMLPGADCLACHTPGNLVEEGDEDLAAAALALEDDDDDDDDEDKYFAAAGTVYADAWGSSPAEGVTVRITDAEGSVVERTTNSAGNFYTSRDLVFPLSLEVERDGQVLEMARETDYGGCNQCHRCDGEAEAKLYAP